MKYSGNLRRDFEKATAEIEKLKDRILGYQESIKGLQRSLKNAQLYSRAIRFAGTQPLVAGQGCRPNKHFQ